MSVMSHGRSFIRSDDVLRRRDSGEGRGTGDDLGELGGDPTICHTQHAGSRQRVEQRVVPCVLSSSLMSTLQTAAAACAVSRLGLHAVERDRVRAIGADTDLTREAECG